MDLPILTALLVAIAALMGSGTAIATVIVTRRGSKDQTEVEERINEFHILQGTIDTLEGNLDRAVRETEELREKVRECRAETNQLQGQISVLLYNVTILSDHIRAHVPEGVPFPRLRSLPHGR